MRNALVSEHGDPGGFRDSAGLGAWLSRDPLFYDGGSNLFSYCDDNPVGGVDTSGLSQDMGGGPNIVRFSWAAFLRPPTSTLLGVHFTGDGRSWSPNSRAFRLEINGMINLSTGTVFFNKQTGVTTRTVTTPKLGWIPKHTYTRVAKAPTSGLNASYCKTSSGGYDVVLNGSASNPLAPGSPPIAFHVALMFDRGGTLKSIIGLHTMYPNMELWTYKTVAGQTQAHQAYGYNPDKYGGTPWSLFRFRQIGGLWP